MFGMGATLITGVVTIPWTCTSSGASASINPDFTVSYEAGTYECQNMLGFDSLMYSQSQATVLALVVGAVVVGIVMAFERITRKPTLP